MSPMMSPVDSLASSNLPADLLGISILNQKDCCHYTSFLARNLCTPEVDDHTGSRLTRRKFNNDIVFLSKHKL